MYFINVNLSFGICAKFLQNIKFQLPFSSPYYTRYVCIRVSFVVKKVILIMNAMNEYGIEGCI